MCSSDLVLEPMLGSGGCIPGEPEFLAAVRDETAAAGVPMIFDEVMTGFRVGPAGAQGLFGITADLVTLGKVIGGGMPLGAFGGRRDIMGSVAPLGPVYQAGTLSGNPVAVAAGLATLEQIAAPGFFERLTKQTEKLVDGLSAAATASGVSFSAQNIGGMFGIYFRQSPPQSYAEVMQCDVPAFNRFFHAMLDSGIYFAPSAFEAGFVSAAHGDAEIDETIEAARKYFSSLPARSA